MPSNCKCGGKYVIHEHTWPRWKPVVSATCDSCGAQVHQKKRRPKSKGQP